MKLDTLVREYGRYQKMNNYSPVTIEGDEYKLGWFLKHHEELGITELEFLTKQSLKDYQEWLTYKQTRTGRLLASASRNGLISTLKMFLRWLKKEDYLATDFSEYIVYGKLPQKLPRQILTIKEMDDFINMPDTRTSKGFRDRLLMEFLYQTAARVSETSHIKIEDVDTKAGTVHIREGKGAKDRIVPIGKGLCDMINEYLMFVREKFLHKVRHGYLLCGRDSKMGEDNIQKVIYNYKQKSGITKPIHPHAFRHACATHMLQNGAPIRHVQEMLGHSNINTTQLYANVTIRDLKKAHARYHPSERRVRNERKKIK